MKAVFTLLAAFTIGLGSYAQIVDDASELSFSERLRYGGNVGATFGLFTQVIAEPTIGYIVTDRYFAGVSVLYQYVQIQDFFGVNEDFQSHYYGFRQLNNFWITPSIFAAGEIELLNYEFVESFSNELNRGWVESVFVGGGFRSSLGGRGFMTLSLLYNLSYDSQSPYNSAFIPRIGIFF
jgi:hypothetical protein